MIDSEIGRGDLRRPFPGSLLHPRACRSTQSRCLPSCRASRWLPQRRRLLLFRHPISIFWSTRQNDPEFRESLLLSDLCPADGMPIVWIARLTGIPIKHRIAGSDIFEALKARPHPKRPLKVFLFGAKESVAAAAARALNVTAGLSCVGWICPGWGTVDELSQEIFIDQINSSNADFLVATLGAVKGQLWLKRNHRRLRIPIRSHLGATVHFQAGTVKRAPAPFRN